MFVEHVTGNYKKHYSCQIIKINILVITLVRIKPLSNYLKSVRNDCLTKSQNYYAIKKYFCHHFLANLYKQSIGFF